MFRYHSYRNDVNIDFKIDIYVYYVDLFTFEEHFVVLNLPYYFVYQILATKSHNLQLSHIKCSEKTLCSRYVMGTRYHWSKFRCHSISSKRLLVLKPEIIKRLTIVSLFLTFARHTLFKFVS